MLQHMNTTCLSASAPEQGTTQGHTTYQSPSAPKAWERGLLQSSRMETGKPQHNESHCDKTATQCDETQADTFTQQTNDNLYTSLITFDITGYFNNVNYKRLLAVLRNKGIPLPISKWVQSFVNSRETRIRVDGYTDRARAVRTGCSQGSPVSGVLANNYRANATRDVHSMLAQQPDNTR